MNKIDLNIIDLYILPYLNNKNNIYYINKDFHYLKKKQMLKLNRTFTNKYLNNYNYRNLINKYEKVHLNIFNIYLPNFVFSNNILLIKLAHSKSKNLNSIKNVKNISLICCNNINSLNQLIKVESITITSCDNIKDLSPLKKCKQVFLNKCNNIFNISSLFNIERIFICECQNINNFNYLINAKLLYIYKCDGLINVSIFKNIQKLHISYCNNITNFKDLNIKNIIF